MPLSDLELSNIARDIDPIITGILSVLEKTNATFKMPVLKIGNLFQSNSIYIADENNTMTPEDFQDFDYLFCSAIANTISEKNGQSLKKLSREEFKGQTNNFMVIKEDGVNLLKLFSKYKEVFAKQLDQILVNFVDEKTIDHAKKEMAFCAIAAMSFNVEEITKEAAIDFNAEGGYDADDEDSSPPSPSARNKISTKITRSQSQGSR